MALLIPSKLFQTLPCIAVAPPSPSQGRQKSPAASSETKGGFRAEGSVVTNDAAHRCDFLVFCVQGGDYHSYTSDK